MRQSAGSSTHLTTDESVGNALNDWSVGLFEMNKFCIDSITGKWHAVRVDKLSVLLVCKININDISLKGY